jgi:thiamine-phosphate pyrophosphorylase
MPNRLVLPPLYVILDAVLLPSDPIALTNQLLHAGVRLLQYRNKTAPAREVLQTAQVLCAEALQRDATFLVNDRPDIARLAGAAGVHLGQDDIDVAPAREVLGRDRIIGLSTHNLEQFKSALETDADYIALGPVFATSSKANPDPVVGLEVVREVRRWTEKPIVAIGGITLERARQVIDAGADSVAVISDILKAKNPADRAQQFLQLLPSAARSAGK